MAYLHTTVLERDVIYVMRFTTADTVNMLSAANIKSFSRYEGHCDYHGDFNSVLRAYLSNLSIHFLIRDT